jgi:hypothetical protein
LSIELPHRPTNEPPAGLKKRPAGIETFDHYRGLMPRATLRSPNPESPALGPVLKPAKH